MVRLVVCSAPIKRDRAKLKMLQLALPPHLCARRNASASMEPMNAGTEQHFKPARAAALPPLSPTIICAVSTKVDDAVVPQSFV